MIIVRRQFLLVASLAMVFANVAMTTKAWLFTLPEGSCSQFDTCQTCVVEYATDISLRRPCTWCPATNDCQMMNHYTGQCSNGATYRDYCPIMSSLPKCVFVKYSFWICYSARLRQANQCNADFVEAFCSLEEENRVVEICNGDSIYLERVSTGFGTENVVEADKNEYGLGINLPYFWFDAGHGEDRRHIISDQTHESFDHDVWICNAQIDPDQATVMKYTVHTQNPTEGGSSKPTDSDASTLMSVSLPACITLLITLVSMIHSQ